MAFHRRHLDKLKPVYIGQLDVLLIIAVVENIEKIYSTFPGLHLFSDIFLHGLTFRRKKKSFEENPAFHVVYDADDIDILFRRFRHVCQAAGFLLQSRQQAAAVLCKFQKQKILTAVNAHLYRTADFPFFCPDQEIQRLLSLFAVPPGLVAVDIPVAQNISDVLFIVFDSPGSHPIFAHCLLSFPY